MDNPFGDTILLMHIRGRQSVRYAGSVEGRDKGGADELTPIVRLKALHSVRVLGLSMVMGGLPCIQGLILSGEKMQVKNVREIVQNDQKVATPKGSANWHGTSHICMHEVEEGTGPWSFGGREWLMWVLPHNAGLTDRKWGGGRDSDAICKVCTMPGSFPTDMTEVCVPKVRSDGDASKGSEWCGFLQEG